MTIQSERKEQIVDDEEQEKKEVRSQWEMAWTKFRRNKIAVIGSFFLLLIVFCAFFAGFISPHNFKKDNALLLHAPPQRIHFLDKEGNFHLRPFTYAFKKEYDPVTYEAKYTEDTSKRYPLKLLARGDSYKFLGVWKTDLHLIGNGKEASLHLLGTDKLGRDVFSRILQGARVSLSVALIGVLITEVIGTLLGGVSGYFGGLVDNIIQRAVELLRSFPRIPLWMALTAALPKSWSPTMVFLGIVVLLGFINWTGLCREIRGKVLSFRESDFVEAARAAGATDTRIIVRHILPSALSHIVVVATLSVPRLILAESALSFLGLGIQPPMVSWGVLLRRAQNLEVLQMAPWVLTPGIAIVLTVLSFNFVGDGLRDAVDPFSNN